MNKDEALRLALEALTDALNKPMWNRVQMEAAITAIKASLEAKDEPVALKPCAYESKEKKMCRKCGQVHAEAIWDTTPPQRTWVGLTDEDIEQEFGFIDELLRDCVQRTEAKLKDNNI
jgi:hypothetical protein